MQQVHKLLNGVTNLSFEAAVVHLHQTHNFTIFAIWQLWRFQTNMLNECMITQKGFVFFISYYLGYIE